MVKELYVSEEPKREQDWEKETTLWYELVYEGVALPEEERALLQDRLDIYFGDRDVSAVKAEKSWDAYLLKMDPTDERSPRERLNEYFAKEQ